MKTVLLTLSIFITILTFGQEKKRINVPEYNADYANLTLDDGIKYKVIQEYISKSNIRMTGKRYNKIIEEGINKQQYVLYKVLRVRPITDNFFNQNILIDYYKNKNDNYIIIKQVVHNDLRLKQNEKPNRKSI